MLDLTGWHLTDSAVNLSKWSFPSVPQSVLEPNEYLIVFASGQANEGYIDPAGYLHTDFKLQAGGEYLALTDQAATIVHEYAPVYPAQQTDVSYGIYPDDLAAGATFFGEPTPGSENAVAAVSDLVEFSIPSRIFQDSLQLELAGMSVSGQSIVYTLDGSVPTDTSAVYANPLLIDSTTQVRARIIEPGKVAGPVRTANYSRVSPELRDFESQLPILLIENFGAGEIPSKDWNQTGAGIQQVERQPASVTLYGNRSGSATFASPVETQTRAGIRTRGAFSTTFPEPQYSLETWGEENDDQAVSVFDMASESDYILYSPNPNYDQTLMNNQFMLEVSRGTSVWAPEVQFVEAFVNTDGGDVTMDDYVGLYVWTEKIKRDPGRLDFDRFAEDGSDGGWLLSINRMDPIPADNPAAQPQHFHTPGPNGVLQTSPNSSGGGDDIPRQYNAFINFEHPNGYDLNATQRAAIEGWFAAMEDVLYDRTGVDWRDPIDGYAKYIDVENFIDYFILNNLSKNGDGLLLSMWLYNPDPSNGGKLKFGPTWDHDLGSFEGSTGSNLRYRADRLWFDRLFDDPAFVQQYEQRWRELRQGVLADESMDQVFDDFAAEIGTDAVERDGVTNLDSRINGVKNWLSARAAAIDNNVGRFEFTANRTSGEPGLEVDFINQTNIDGNNQWQWDFGDGATSTLRNPTHTYDSSGFYDVSLTVTNEMGSLTVSKPEFVSVLVAGDVNVDGELTMADVNQFVANWRFDTTQLESIEQIQRGDLNRDGITDLADWGIIHQAWIAQGGRPLRLGTLLKIASYAKLALPHQAAANGRLASSQIRSPRALPASLIDMVFKTDGLAEEDALMGLRAEPS